MISLQLVTPANAMHFKALRLRALSDTPTAFSSTYAAESRLSDRNWIERAQEWSSKRSTMYLAMDVENPCGIVSGFLDRGDTTRAHLASMAQGEGNDSALKIGREVYLRRIDGLYLFTVKSHMQKVQEAFTKLLRRKLAAEASQQSK